MPNLRTLGSLALVLATSACGREREPPHVAPPSQAAAIAAAPAPSDAGGAAPARQEAAPDAGPSPCEGSHVDVTATVTDARCVFYDEERATALRTAYEEEIAKAPPIVRGQVVGDAEVEIEVTNTSPRTLVVPLFLSQVIDLYPATARRGKTSVRVRADQRGTQGTARWDHGRNFAAISLPPGGTASVRLTLDPTIEESTYDCPPNAKCSPTKTTRGPLPAGTWEIEIGLPIYGTPLAAKLAWTKR